jgi:hypothetical protein
MRLLLLLLQRMQDEIARKVDFTVLTDLQAPTRTLVAHAVQNPELWTAFTKGKTNAAYRIRSAVGCLELPCMYMTDADRTALAAAIPRMESCRPMLLIGCQYDY